MSLFCVLQLRVSETQLAAVRVFDATVSWCTVSDSSHLSLLYCARLPSNAVFQKHNVLQYSVSFLQFFLNSLFTHSSLTYCLFWLRNDMRSASHCTRCILLDSLCSGCTAMWHAAGTVSGEHTFMIRKFFQLVCIAVGAHSCGAGSAVSVLTAVWRMLRHCIDCLGT